jgi:hypothetical protein
MRLIRCCLVSLVVLSLAGSLQAWGKSHWTMTHKEVIGGEGAWDYVTLDPEGKRLFVTRTTHTMVLDADSLKVLADIPGQQSAHGVALVPTLQRGFITDGAGSGTILVFDLRNYSVLGKLAAVPDADGIVYDAGTNLILVSAGDSSSLLAFSPDIDPNGKVGDPIALGGKPEFLATDGRGKAFVNLQNKDLVAEVDLKARKVLDKWPVAPGGQPVGLSIDRKTHRLFIGCRNPQKLVVMNTENGKVETSVPIGVGVDATAFARKQAFASCRDGQIIVAGSKNGFFTLTETVQTPEGARTMTIDPKRQRIYLPTAELEPNPTGRPRPKPGTFMIVVVEHR